MKYRLLPRTDLALSEVGFGVWTLATTWWGTLPEEDQLLLLHMALDLGITFFDTADAYGNGYGEDVLAKALGRERHDIVIATKFGYDFYDKLDLTGPRRPSQKFEPDFIKFACEQSLRRLKTDYIDLYQLHNPRIDTLEKDEVFEVLDQLVKEGKIRHYGAALGPGVGWFEEGDASIRERKLCSVEVVYGLIEQEPAREFFPTAAQEQVGIISRMSATTEVLTGKRSGLPAFATEEQALRRDHLRTATALKDSEQLRFLVEDTGRTLGQAAVKFCLAQPTISSALPNITNLADLHEYAASPDTPDLSDEEQKLLQDLWENGFDLEGAESIERVI